MLRKGFRIARVFKIDIELNLTAIILFGFILWIVIGNWLPILVPNQPTSSYWLFGVIAALIIVFSLLVHELSHSLIARRFGLSTKKITLFALGAVAQLEKEPESAKSEFWIASAGPFASIVLAIIFGVLAMFVKTEAQLITASFVCLSGVNFILAVFNLLPAFPMDGGRIFRAFWWWILKDQLKATKIAGLVGQGFGALMVLGGVFIGQLWFVIMGIFLFFIAGRAYRNLVTQKALDQIKTSQVAARNLMEDIIEAFKPVDVEREAICGPEDSLIAVLEKMSSLRCSIIFVVENNEAIGMITREGISEYIKSKEKEKK